MGISANFVDSTNGARAVEALREEGLNDSTAANNAQALEEALARSCPHYEADGDTPSSATGGALNCSETNSVSSDAITDNLDQNGSRHISYQNIVALAASKTHS